MGHSDGKLSEVWKIEPIFQTSFKRLDTGEISFYDSHVVSIRGHAHQAAESYMTKPFGSAPFDSAQGPGKDCLYLILCESSLGLLCPEMELKKDIYDLVMLTPPLLDRIQKVQGINRFHKRGIRQDIFQLVSLEMADEMPLDIVRKLPDLCGKLLRAVLAESPLTRPVDFQNLLGRMEFRNCHQFDFRWQFLKYSFKIIFYHSSLPAPSASGPASSGLPPDAAATCSWAVSSLRWPSDEPGFPQGVQTIS